MSQKVWLFANGVKVTSHEKQVTDVLENEGYKLLGKISSSVAAMAKARAPKGRVTKPATPGRAAWTARNKGTLKESIRAIPSRYGKKGGWLVVAGSFMAFYARFVELGTPGVTIKKSTTPIGERRVGKPRTPIPEVQYLLKSVRHHKRWGTK